MKVLVDTPVWSLALRRKRRPEVDPAESELASLVTDGRAALIGPIRQEILSGLQEHAQFDGSNTDFLICAIAVRNDFPIFTTDRDFSHFAGVLPIRLHQRQS